MRAQRTLSASAAAVTLAFLALLGTGTTHTIARGETLAEIARRYGVSAGELARANGITDPNRIYAGAELRIPQASASAGSASAPATTTYVVRRGDTLGSIASRHGTTISKLVALNRIANPNLIRIGQALKVPMASGPGGSGGGSGGAATSGTPVSTPKGGATHHVVKAGETISGIAARYEIPAAQLISANGLTNGTIYVGQRLLLVPVATAAAAPAGTTHTIAKGETLSSIAQRYGTTVKAIVELNGIANPNAVYVGQVVKIPATSGGSGALQCPVKGSVRFMNDWGFPRSGGRFHEGNDLFAARGTPAVAVVDGTAQQTVGHLGGNQVKLKGADGAWYYYTHLDAFGAAGPVTAGQVIGYVGNTGNAVGGPTHVHFEVHPGGGPAVNPYPRIVGVC